MKRSGRYQFTVFADRETWRQPGPIREKIIAVQSGVLSVVLALAASSWSFAAKPTAAKLDQSDVQAASSSAASHSEYLGDQICGSCHREKFESFSKTAHHLTSRVADADSIIGSFSPGANLLKTSNPGLSFRMEFRAGRFYEKALFGVAPSVTSQTEPMDLVIGSGRKGQSYLYWKGDKLFQLPVSYWVGEGWVNSPGYDDGEANFDRPVMPRCLECHGTYAESFSPKVVSNGYRHTSVVLGISCERCHGPGREHVALHQSASQVSVEKAIVNPAKLPRDREIDVCAQCHAGMRYPIAAAFSYRPGQRLDDYLDRGGSDSGSRVDVHGGQVALLQKSRCYQSSSTLTCSTCHDVHTPQRDSTAFADRCLTCHKVSDCGMLKKTGNTVTTGCIDCHMPLQESKAIISTSNGRRISARVRNHWIKVYSETAASQ